MRYTIKHVTRFVYDAAISESVMEARMQPRSDGLQRCLHFSLSTSPGSRVLMYQDHDGNSVHHFNIPGRHSRLTLTTDALVECSEPPELPYRLGPQGWSQLDALAASGEWFELLAPSAFTQPSELLTAFASELGLTRGNDPLVLLRRLTSEMYKRFEYAPRSTRVDSPIDDALRSRRGVCQDFAHVFIALARSVGIPTRYVSGYLFHEGGDRSTDGATHAWAEALLPEVGWVGFDPTNNLLAGDRHVRVAIGRDYADVPPTRGVYKGSTAVKSELAVAVQVGPAQSLFGSDPVPFTPWKSRDAAGQLVDGDLGSQDQVQDQQQQ